MVKKIFVQITVACLVLAMMIAMVSADDDEPHEGDGHDHASAPEPSSKKPSSAVFVAVDMFTGLAAAAVALVAGFIYWVRNSLFLFSCEFVCAFFLILSSFLYRENWFLF